MAMATCRMHKSTCGYLRAAVVSEDQDPDSCPISHARDHDSDPAKEHTQSYLAEQQHATHAQHHAAGSG
eukprot:41113-Rhodomonas_salina.2